jgi:Xaa-Pro aminopeptidase
VTAARTDWTPPVDDIGAVFADRVRRAGTAMTAGNVDTAVFVSSGRHLFTDMDPVIWLTGFKPMRAASVVLESGGDYTLYAQGEWEAARARQLPSAPDVVAADDPFAAAAAALERRGRGRMGSAGARKLNTVEYRTLISDTALELVGIDAELDEQARTKDVLELAQFRRASEIAQIGFDSLREQLRIGMTDVEAEAIIERRLRELGADDAFVFLSASTRNRAVQRPWGRVLMPGDILLTELSPCVGGVFAQICRTVAFGTPSKDLVRDHQMLVDVMAAGVAACTSGNTVSAVVAAMDAPFVAQGMEQYTKPPFMRVRGHGMGFGSVAPGDFLSRNMFELQTGDSFVLHPNQMMPGAGYLMCGEPVIVGADAGDVVTAEIAGLEIVES